MGILSLTTTCLLKQGTGSLWVTYSTRNSLPTRASSPDRRFPLLLSHSLCWGKGGKRGQLLKRRKLLVLCKACLPAFIRWGLSHPPLYIPPLLLGLMSSAWEGSANPKPLASQSCSSSHYLTQCLLLEPCHALCPLLHHLVQPNCAGL